MSFLYMLVMYLGEGRGLLRGNGCGKPKLVLTSERRELSNSWRI